LWVRDVGSGAEHRLVETPADDKVPSYSPDASAITFESTRTPDWGPGGAPAGSTAVDVHAALNSPSR